jgi:hypothetical protein
MEEIIFRAAFESLKKDREGEIKLTFAVPLSDEHLVRAIPIQQSLRITVEEDAESPQE